LDDILLQTVADSYIKGMSIERYLQQASLAEYSSGVLKLKMAALLLFAKDIQKWHPRSQVRVLKVSGAEVKSGKEYNVISDEIIRGNIFELIEKSWEYLRAFLAIKTELNTEAKFEQRFIYPERVCREALINAIAHRDYSIQNGIDVFIFTDRIEIKSPGALLSTLTIKYLEELQGAHESRNVFIAKILRENKYMRELGEGMKRIFQLMEQNELQKPKLYSNTTWFSVTLYHKSLFTAQQEEWLMLFDTFNLSPNQKKIIVLGMNDKEISPDDIKTVLATRDAEIYQKEVTILRHTKILEEIRTNLQASQFAKKNNISKSKVPCFKISIPKVK
jgi:ATP-dependent DNA helicase RecG